MLANAVYPPLVNPQGHASGEGVDIEIAREALRRGGFDGAIEIQWVPWKRVLFMLEHGTADFTTTANFSAERDRFLQWSAPYRAGVRYHFYTRKGTALKLQQLEDLRGHRLALSAGFIYPKAVLEVAGAQVEYGRDVGSVVVGFDARSYSEPIANAIVLGLLSTGARVTLLGVTTTPPSAC